MNRPKKKKAENPTLPKDQQVDERNLVDTEESEEISIEDKIHLYWVENKTFISGCIAALAIVIIGINGTRIYQQYSEASIQEAYAEARAEDDLGTFAKDYPTKDLGGFAALMVADEHYAEEDYTAALEFYEIAASALENDLLAARAEIGAAFATFLSGDESAGRARLEAIAANTEAPQAVRQEAAYHLAIEADVDGDEAAFDRYASQVTESGIGGQWQQRLQLYQQQR